MKPARIASSRSAHSRPGPGPTAGREWHPAGRAPAEPPARRAVPRWQQPGLPSPPAGAERRHTTQHGLFPSHTQLPVSRREGKATGSVMCSPSALLPKLKAEDVEGYSLAAIALSLEMFVLDLSIRNRKSCREGKEG